MLNNPVLVAAYQEDEGPTPTITLTSTPTITPIPPGELIIDQVEAELAVDLNNNDLVDPGDTLRYTIDFRNAGATDITELKVIDDYDQSKIAEIKNISSNGSRDENKITWDLGVLEPGEESQVSYEATLKSMFSPKGSQLMEDSVTISGKNTNTASYTLPVEIKVPKLQVSKEYALVEDVNGDGEPSSGDTLEYTITIKSDGDVEATGLVLVDDYDESRFDSITEVSEGGKNSGKDIVWESSKLAPGEELVVSYQARLLSTFAQGKTKVENTVTLSTDRTESIQAENSFVVEVLPTPVPTLEPTPVPSEAVNTGPKGEGIDPEWLAYLAAGFLVLSSIGLALILYACSNASNNTNNKTNGNPKLLRDSFFLVLLMGSVIILGLAGSIERSAVAGLIGTLAGYVLKGITTKD
jgi:hypothetical protein